MRKAEPSGTVGPMVEAQATADPKLEEAHRRRMEKKQRDRAALRNKNKPKPIPRETAEEKTRRHWLTRFVVRALAVDPPFANLPLDKEGFALGTKILSAAQGAKDSPEVPAKMETLALIATHSNGQIERKHDETKGFMFRSTSRIKEEKQTKKSFSKSEVETVIAESKKKARKNLEKKRDANAQRAANNEKRQKKAAVEREENRQKRLEAARQRALKDPKNVRRIASPNDPKVLARIAPPMKRAGKGTTVEDAKQAVADRKKK